MLLVCGNKIGARIMANSMQKPTMNVKQYLADIGRKGGKIKSRAKAAAAKANGRLGGRPKIKRVTRRANTKLTDGGCVK